MNPLVDLLSETGAAMRPHPATVPAPGDGSHLVITPDDTWISLDSHRTDTTVALLMAPRLERQDFTPNAVGTTSIVSPAVNADRLLDAVVAVMGEHDAWTVRADRRTGGPTWRTMDLLGGYRTNGVELALSSVVTVSICDDHAVLHQIHVTSTREQLGEHTEALAAMRVHGALMPS